MFSVNSMANKKVQLGTRLGLLFLQNYSLIVWGSVVAIIALGSYLVYPQFTDYQNMVGGTLPQAEKRLDNAQAALSAVRNSKVEFDRFGASTEIAKLSKVLPDDKAIAELFLQLNNFAKQDGFELNKVSVSEDLSAAELNDFQVAGGGRNTVNLKKLTIQLSMTGGGYQSLKQVLNTFEQSLRLYDIKSLSFTPNFSGDTGYNMTIETYYLELDK